MKGMAHRPLLLSAAAMSAGLLATQAGVMASPIDLGGAANYAVLGSGGTAAPLSDFEVYQSGTVITGNVGVGPYSIFTHGIDASINGALTYHSVTPPSGNVTLPAITGTITGGTHAMDLSAVVADARTASAAAAALTPTQTLSTLTEGSTLGSVDGAPTAHVIRVTDSVTLKTTFHLVGDPTDSFVFQLVTADKDALVLSGVVMDLSGGLTADNVIWNLNGASDIADVSITSGECSVQGIFLAPDRNITVDNADVLGSVIGGGSGHFLSIHSTSTITAVPEPIMAGLLGIVGLSLLLKRRSA